MKQTIVPAQITTVEDKIVANLNLTQIALIAASLFIGVAIFAVLPQKLHFNLYKLAVIAFSTLTCLTLALRIKGKVLLNWILLLSGYYSRPKLYVYDKNDSYLREIVYFPQIKKRVAKKEALQPVKTVNPNLIPITDFNKLERVLTLHRGKLDLRIGKDGIDAIWQIKH